MTFWCCMSTQPKPCCEVSQYTTKWSVPSGKDSIGASHSLLLRSWKASSCLSPKSYFLSFYVKEVSG
ncbi:hypothetical protein HanIR_Chr10g0454591 [Helianthus annuus]|nr:hypothetical protein HanIR_Chr10g0454591 [Helianthus annuus]